MVIIVNTNKNGNLFNLKHGTKLKMQIYIHKSNISANISHLCDHKFYRLGFKVTVKVPVCAARAVFLFSFFIDEIMFNTPCRIAVRK